MSAHNLIWVQIEGGGGGCALPVANHPEPIESVPFPATRLTNMVCGWISTIGSVSGLMTGLSPAYLLRNHVSKGQAADGSRFSLPHDPLPVLLEKQGYHVDGFSTFLCFREQIPFFGEKHSAIADDSHFYIPGGYCPAEGCVPVGRVPDGRDVYLYEHVSDSSNLTAPDYTTLGRVRRHLEALDTDAPKALFLHFETKDIIPELFEVLAKNGLNEDNSVMLVMGDHGFPNERHAIAQRLAYGHKMPHDKGMTEQDLRVSGFLGVPGRKETTFDELCISWDMAPTVAELLGFSDTFSEATGTSLAPHLDDATKYTPRTLRIDNRYVEQEDLKIVCLMDDEYRYVFRFRPHWSGGPYYSYHLDPVACVEELYRRDDLNEQENLIFSPQHLPVLHRFRSEFRRTEEAIINHHFGSNVFAYPALERARFSVPEPFRNTNNGMVPASQARVFRGLLSGLKLEMQDKGVTKPLLVGSAQEVRAFFDYGVFTAADFTGAATGDEGSPVAGLRAIHMTEMDDVDFDAIILASLDQEMALFAHWNAVNERGVPILSPYRRLERDFDPAWPLAIPDGDLLDYFRNTAGVIYGAGGRAQDFLNDGGYKGMGMTFRAIFDSSLAKHGTEECGLPVSTYTKLSAEEIEELDFGYFLIASFSHFAILKDLQHWTLRGKKIFYLADDLKIQPDGLPREGTWLPLKQL